MEIAVENKEVTREEFLSKLPLYHPQELKADLSFYFQEFDIQLPHNFD